MRRKRKQPIVQWFHDKTWTGAGFLEALTCEKEEPLWNDTRHDIRRRCASGQSGWFWTIRAIRRSMTSVRCVFNVS